MTERVNEKSNSVSRTLKLKEEEELSVTKHKKGSSLDDIDIIAINEWIETKEGVEYFSSLRAIAFICKTVDGLEELFFKVAKELPNKLELKSLSIESVMESLEGIDKDVVPPFEYIKTVQKLLGENEKSKKFTESFDNNILKDSLDEFKCRFKLIGIEEYQKLLDEIENGGKGQRTEGNLENLFAYAKKLDFKRNFLKDLCDEKKD